MPSLINIKGKKFNRLTVLYAERKNNKVYWVCKCECGKFTSVVSQHLRNGCTRSCGCIHREMLSGQMTTHGKLKTNLPEYRSWQSLKNRCLNPKNAAYKNYGGRGVSVCEEWKESFINFLNDMGGRPTPKHSLDRIDVNGNYEKNNCRWATDKQQASNTRKNVFIEHNGIKLTITDWARTLNANPASIRYMLKRFSVDDVYNFLKDRSHGFITIKMWKRNYAAA